MLQGSTASKPRRSGARRRARLPSVSREAIRSSLPEIGLALLVLGFIGVTAWWLGADQTPPDGDAARHVHVAFNFEEQLAHGHLGYPFRFEPGSGAIYPPLVFLVGALPLFLVGLSVDAAVIALNIVFVPLLAISCYGIGRLVYGNRWAGLLAAVFALATPVVIGQFHLFMLDLALSAMVAAGAWALLATDHYANRRLSILAGVVLGLGMLTKQSFVVFLAPVAALLLVRGGYRNWRNVALFALAAAVVAGPWYVKHLDGLTRVAREATTQGSGINPYGTSFQRWSPENYAWYGWTLADVHYFVPLTLFFIVGTVTSIVSWVRERVPRYLPELLAGVLAGYVGVAIVLGFQDARYSMPALVFIAVLGGGWIARARTVIRIPAVALLLIVLVVNTLSISAGTFGNVELRFSKRVVDHWLDPALTVIGDKGYSAGPADQSGRTLDILEAARRDGVTAFSFDPAPQTINLLSPNGLAAFGREADVVTVQNGTPIAREPNSIFLAVRGRSPGDPPPCTRFKNGSELYVFRGPAATGDPHRERSLVYCPLR